MTLKRLEREEQELVEAEQKKQRLLATGRLGRTSLLTSGFTGPGSTESATSASVRASEQEDIKEKAASSRAKWGEAAKGKGFSRPKVFSRPDQPQRTSPMQGWFSP